MDESLTIRDIAEAVRASKRGRWQALLRQLPTAPALPDSGAWRRRSAPAGSSGNTTQRPVATVGMRQLEETCAVVEVVLQWHDSDGYWNSLTVTFKVCYGVGGGGAYSWMVNNGYAQGAYIVVDADKYNVPQTDAVTFRADVVTHSLEIPFLLGWTWTPAPGVTDPWTTACTDNGLTCSINVHGSGRIAFDAVVGGQPVTGTVQVHAFVPPEIGDGEGDADFAAGPGVSAGTTPIAAQQSTAILADAVRMGEWVYTQGCAQCAGGPFAEPAVNIPAQYGDCTDFVWSAVKRVLGPRWPHTKISTRMFNTFDDLKLVRNGYVRVDSASARRGDIVVKTKLSGCYCGHAGIFTGWGAGGNPIGHANNGRPATPTRQNEDRNTGPFNFKVRSGEVVKFFRPAT